MNDIANRLPDHDGLWMDIDGDTWSVDLCTGKAILIHDGYSWLADQTPQPIDAIADYAPFERIRVPAIELAGLG